MLAPWVEAAGHVLNFKVQSVSPHSSVVFERVLTFRGHETSRVTSRERRESRLSFRLSSHESRVSCVETHLETPLSRRVVLVRRPENTAHTNSNTHPTPQKERLPAEGAVGAVERRSATAIPSRPHDDHDTLSMSLEPSCTVRDRYRRYTVHQTSRRQLRASLPCGPECADAQVR